MIEIVFKKEGKEILSWGKFRTFPYALTGYSNEENTEFSVVDPFNPPLPEEK